MMASRSWVSVAIAALVGALLLTLATRNMVSHVPTYDELLHVLSARGVVSTGQPAIADGVYDRAQLFTRLVAVSYRMFGDNLAAARLPALISTLLLVALLAGWVARHAGFLAGAASGAVLAISANTIGLAIFARFYTLHALFVVVACIAAYEATVPGRRMWVRLAAVAIVVVTIALAFLLQITTVVAAGALVAGVLAVLACEQGSALNVAIRSRPYVFALIVLAGLIVAAVLEWQLGLIAHATEAPRWAEGNSGRVLFYLISLNTDLPFLWPLFPLAAVAALYQHRRLAVFCIVVFASALAVHSIAAAKAVRYVYYALPFLCAVMGCGVAVAVRATVEWFSRVAPAVPAMATALLLWLIIPLGLSQEGQRAARFITGKDGASQLGMYAGEANWALGASVLDPALKEADVVVVSSGVKGLFYLGRYDYELNGTAVSESESGEEFGRDPRTGRGTVSLPESLSQVLTRSHRALIVLDDDKVGRDSGVSMDVMTLIGDRCRRLPLPAGTGASAWTCPTGV